MALFEKINADILEAMRNREKDRLAALRDVKSKYLLEAAKDGAPQAALERERLLFAASCRRAPRSLAVGDDERL